MGILYGILLKWDNKVEICIFALIFRKYYDIVSSHWAEARKGKCLINANTLICNKLTECFCSKWCFPVSAC